LNGLIVPMMRANDGVPGRDGMVPKRWSGPKTISKGETRHSVSFIRFCVFPLLRPPRLSLSPMNGFE